ncbi:MAG: TetR/AcrR family transcriptional regulator C-terminal domain-containing protein [Olegusella sp.]|nr:TetR/AcrR family transcriptional regulator C-terminal domain-containing protein [Olegusella sp.]
MQQTLDKRAERQQCSATDPRSTRTRRALRNALAAEIAASGDLTQVTVTAVTDRAGVTRRTFYSHFRDIPDLVMQVEQETIADLRPLVTDLAQVDLDGLSQAIERHGACPGADKILTYFKEREGYLAPLLGEGGDPAFTKRIEAMVREQVEQRAKSGLDLELLSHIFDYYLTFAISAEVGVLVRWLTTGAHESVELMARVMTALMFVRPGDLYGKQIDFDVSSFGMALLASLSDDDLMRIAIDTEEKTDHD